MVIYVHFHHDLNGRGHVLVSMGNNVVYMLKPTHYDKCCVHYDLDLKCQSVYMEFIWVHFLKPMLPAVQNPKHSNNS